jgi:chemotaxis protein MotB
MQSKRILTALAAALLLSGCVSLGKYKALQADNGTLKAKNDDLESQIAQIHKEASGLQQDLGTAKEAAATLDQQKSSLEKEKGALQSDKDALQAKTDELTKTQAALTAKTAELEQQKAGLEAEKAALLKESQAKQAQYDSLVGDLQKEVSDGQLKITQYKNMLTVDVADKILFDSGRADLKKEGLDVLKKVGDALAKSDKVIRVVGHTDNVPLSSGAAYASNWELSAARATTVVRFLQEKAKLEPARLIAAGRGEFAPVAPNDTPANKQKNRRIEITLLDKALVDAVAAPAPPEAAAPQPASPTAKP